MYHDLFHHSCVDGHITYYLFFVSYDEHHVHAFVHMCFSKTDIEKWILGTKGKPTLNFKRNVKINHTLTYCTNCHTCQIISSLKRHFLYILDCVYFKTRFSLFVLPSSCSAFTLIALKVQLGSAEQKKGDWWEK